VTFPNNSSIGYITGNNGVILKSLDSIHFYGLPTGVNDPLYGIDFLDQNTGYVVGYNGKILKTTNGGSYWYKLESGVSSPLTSVCFFNDTTSYVCGDGGAILKTNDMGDYWYQQFTGTSNNFMDIWVTSIDTGLVAGAGATILKTVMGGGFEPQNISENFNAPDIHLNVYPNPFVGTLYIDYEITDRSEVSMGIFDISGRLVSSITNEVQAKGNHKITFNSPGYPDGVYVLFIRINNYYYSEKLVILH